MASRPIVIIAIALLLILPIIPPHASAHAPTAVLYVDDDNTQGPWDGTPDHPYQHITDAVANATDNDTIYIENGTYHEQITLTKPLTIQGQEKNTTLVTADGKGSILTIGADHVCVTDLTFLNSAGRPDTAAVDIHADHTIISRCIIYRHRLGIAITGHTDLTVTDCMIHVTQQGIHIVNSSRITITDTYLYHNAISILLKGSSAATINACFMHTNGVGCYAQHDTALTITHCAFCDNNDNQGGVFLRNTTSTTITDSYFKNNGVGVGIKSSNDTTIAHSTFIKNTHFAVKLWNATATTLQNNSFDSNLRNAVYAEYSTLTYTRNLLHNDTNYGLYAAHTTANATRNWWGSALGPARTSYSTRADRGSRGQGTLQYYPWLFTAPNDTGITWDPLTQFTAPQHPDTWKPTLTLPGSDTDGDGAPDWWEIKWGYDPTVPDDHAHLDPDGDGLTNLQECFTDAMGSNPFHKDIFLEIDWLTSLTPNVTNQPPQKYLDQMIAPYAQHNITLHVDTGNFGGGEELPSKADLTYEDIGNDYWDHFLNDDLNNPRKGVFHYGLLCDDSEGGGFVVIGWDDLDSFTIACQRLQEKYTHFARGRLSVGGSMHELGHLEGLIAARFGGIDNMAATHLQEKGFWEYRHYHSCLNYCYTYFLMNYSDGSHGTNDFNDWAHLNFTFFKATEFALPS